MTIDADFEGSVAPYRGELLAHCYRMLGSVHDAEDVLQETLVRAWRARDRYDESRASLRTWLYRIATNACLTALESRSRRPLPTGLVGRSEDSTDLTSAREIPWLEPLPDALLGTDPAAVAALRDSLRLALVAAMQVLPARQRAILVLREVLEWPAADVATALSTTVSAVNSGLKRARATLAQAGVQEERLTAPEDPASRAVVERYAEAFAAADMDALTALLTEDVILEMPPFMDWFIGRADFGRVMAKAYQRNGTDWRTVAIGVNGQPALVAYANTGDGAYVARSLQVLTVVDGAIRHNVCYIDPTLFPGIGIEPVLGGGVEAAVPECASLSA